MEKPSLLNSEDDLIRKYLTDTFDYDELRYTKLDYRGA